MQEAPKSCRQSLDFLVTIFLSQISFFSFPFFPFFFFFLYFLYSSESPWQICRQLKLVVDDYPDI